jgi:predicted DNA-binding ribbon-helix-helix protein
MPALATRIRKRSLTVAGHRTSISLEEPFWRALREVAAEQGCSTAELVARIDAARGAGGLSSAIRVYLLEYVRDRGR